MAHKKKHTNPVPADNRPKIGPAVESNIEANSEVDKHSGAPFEEQDPNRRLGNYETKGEHSFQQPGGKNDANH